MTWVRRFVAVPTSALRVDADVAVQSPKGYSEQELRMIAATVPVVYDRIAAGWTSGDFAAARRATMDDDRRVGETYARLFQDSPSSAPLRASYDGTDLVVDQGNHRVRAARHIGVPVLPVWVGARSEGELDRIEQACARRIEREGFTTHRQAHELQVSSHGTRHSRDRTDRSRGPEFS